MAGDGDEERRDRIRYFLGAQESSKEGCVRRESQADKTGRRHCRPAPVAGKILRARIGASAIRPLEYFPFGLASPALR